MPTDQDGAAAPAEASPAPSEPMVAEVEAPHPLAAKIDAWFSEVIASCPMDLPTQIHGHLLAAVSELKQQLTA